MSVLVTTASYSIICPQRLFIVLKNSKYHTITSNSAQILRQHHIFTRTTQFRVTSSLDPKVVYLLRYAFVYTLLFEASAFYNLAFLLPLKTLSVFYFYAFLIVLRSFLIIAIPFSTIMSFYSALLEVTYHFNSFSIALGEPLPHLVLV